MGRGRAVVPALLALLVGGCTAGPANGPAPGRLTPGVTVSAAPTGPDAATCPAAVGPAADQGVGHGATLYAMFFVETADWVVGHEIKIVWRMTGTGELSMTATDSSGRTLAPLWGPEPHSGSTFNRPGDEWGTGWVFPTSGCWTFRAVRPGSGTSAQTAELAVRVA